MQKFRDSRVVVTGAGSGIGRELVRQLYSHTKKILAVDYLPENLDSLQAEFPALEGMLLVDLSSKEGNDQILTWLHSHKMQVDYCFANAGIATYAPAAEQNWKEMDRLFQLNVHSPIQLGLALRAAFPQEPFRHVITCSAMAYWAIPGYSLYSSTKAALLQWAHCLWGELAGDWLTLAFPISTNTAFFEVAGKNVPKAFPMQSPQHVARCMLQGAADGRKKVFPSLLFQTLLELNRVLFFLRPLAQHLEFIKLTRWISKSSPS